MLTPEYLRSKYDAADAYNDYVAKGNPKQQEAWASFRERAALADDQQSLIGGFTRQLHAIVVSGVWCGDCVQQVPFLDAIEHASNGKLIARYLDRDEHMDLAEQLTICGGNRVPVVLLLNEDFDFLSLVGDRTLSRYRAMAARQLGPSCPVPGAPIPDDEVAATRQDWVDAAERAHLIARTSTKLRQRHGD